MTGKEFAMEKEKSSGRRHAGRGNLPPSESEIEGILKSPPASSAPKDKRVVQDESGAGAEPKVSRKVKRVNARAMRAKNGSHVETEDRERVKKGEHDTNYRQQKKPIGKEATVDEEREEEAAGAGDARTVSGGSLNPGSPAKRSKKESQGRYRKNRRKIGESWEELPTAEIVFEGGRLKIDNYYGSHTFEIKGKSWPGKQKGSSGGKDSDVWGKLFHVNYFWPIPAFPAAGVSVDLDVAYRAGLDASFSINYSVWRHPETDQWVASLSGKLQAFAFFDLGATLTGGVELNVIRNRGGAGVFARASAGVRAGTEGGLEGEFNLATKEGALNAFLDFVLGGDLKGSLGVAVWVRGWFADLYREWTFADFPIAYFRGAKLPLAVQLAGPGGCKVLPGKPVGPEVGFGKAPELK